MVARFTGVGLGLLAFTITIVAGVWIQNSVTVTLSRSILALFVFCLIGFVLGSAADIVVAEHETGQAAKVREHFREDQEDSGQEGEPGSQEDSPVDP